MLVSVGMVVERLVGQMVGGGDGEVGERVFPGTPVLTLSISIKAKFIVGLTH